MVSQSGIDSAGISTRYLQRSYTWDMVVNLYGGFFSGACCNFQQKFTVEPAVISSRNSQRSDLDPGGNSGRLCQNFHDAIFLMELLAKFAVARH